MTTAKMVVMLRKELNLFEEHIRSTANLDVYAGGYIQVQWSSFWRARFIMAYFSLTV